MRTTILVAELTEALSYLRAYSYWRTDEANRNDIDSAKEIIKALINNLEKE